MTPRGSKAAAALRNLIKVDLKVTLNPETDSLLVQQYTAATYTHSAHSPMDAFRDARAKTKYLNWREANPDRQFYLLHNSRQRLFGAVWLEPSELSLPRADAHFYEGTDDIWLNTLQVIHAYAERSSDLLKYGAAMSTTYKTPRLLAVCHNLGYTALETNQPPEGSGNDANLMVVSPERLKDLNVGTTPPPRPALRLITGD